MIGDAGSRRIVRCEHVEGHLGGRAEKLAKAGRILRARQLHENAVAADALDRRFGNADLVDALANDSRLC
jgi:hypothetical protein